MEIKGHLRQVTYGNDRWDGILIWTEYSSREVIAERKLIVEVAAGVTMANVRR